MSQVREKKAKLRTARDVLSRLRWSPPDSDGGAGGGAAGRVVLGYADRINGTLEKAVEDDVPASRGGDIPEHRILYFRRVGDEGECDARTALARTIIWDRAGRVDRVFDSGRRAGEVSEETLAEARAAAANVARLEEEGAERRERRARLRARRARSRAAAFEAASAAAAASEGDAEVAAGGGEGGNRFRWESIPWHRYDGEGRRWEQGGVRRSADDREDTDDLTVLSWNVLSNIHPGVDTDEHGIGGHASRWSLLAAAIRERCPDIVALQEATPDFVEQMLGVDWIRKDYASSASPGDKSSVDPIGNMLLWRTCRVDAAALHACVDGDRRRAVSADFRFGPDNTALICANVHLPADKPGVVRAEEKVSRQAARRRELSSVVGHLQTVGSRLKRAEPRTDVSYLVVGDFNCVAADLEDGSFAGAGGHFLDVWSEGEDPGHTFDPTGNPRATKSSSNPAGRRIDRMYLGAGAGLEPVEADVVRGSSEADAVPPSDHYGLHARFVRRGSSSSHLYDPVQCRDAWAANAPSSKDSMLAIVLDSEEMERIKEVHDRDSSLPSPHVTMLYGFVEMHHGSLDLAIQAIRDGVNCAFQERPPPPRAIHFSGESLDVFEHQSSATLIVRPDVDHIGNRWLIQLYRSLVSRFRCCNDQEQHSAEGFIPHVSLGKFGFTSSARKVAAELVDTMSCFSVPVRSIDVLERSQNGKFRSIATVPISSTPENPAKGLRHIVHDTGSAASSLFSNKSQMVLSCINRAIRAASRSFDCLHLTSEAVPYGSVALDCALPKMSDLDVVIVLRTNHENVSHSQFVALAGGDCLYLKKVMACTRDLHSMARMRLRRIRSGLNVLSIQIQPNLPLADIVLCLLGRNGKPVTSESNGAFTSLQDNEYLITALADMDAGGEEVENGVSAKAAFCASLRLMKLWAYNRAVYGAKFGFLGGGAWAIFLVHIMRSKGGKAIFAAATSLSEAAHLLTLAFFEEASRWPWPRPIALVSGDEIEDQSQTRLAVLSPSSAVNLAKNSTISTCLSTVTELLRASTIAKGIAQNETTTGVSALQSILSPLRLQEAIKSYPEVIALELVCDNGQSQPAQHLPDDVEAWGCGRYLSFLVSLERRLDTSMLRPFSQASRVQQGWYVKSRKNYSAANEGFVWIIGLCGILSTKERDMVKDASCRIASGFGESMGVYGLILSASVLSSDDAIGRIAD